MFHPALLQHQGQGGLRREERSETSFFLGWVVSAPSNVPASPWGHRYLHPHGGTAKCTSTPAWGWVPASLGGGHHQT